VVGGGSVAERKVASLLDAGAFVRVVSPDLTESLHRHVEEGRVEWVPHPFSAEWLEGCSLVFAATDDRDANAQIAASARERQRWVNVVDSLEESTFIVPATVQRGALQIAVSTEGSSPALGRRIREELENRYGEEYETFCTLLAEVRHVAKERLPSPEERQRYFTALLDSDVLDLIRQNRIDEARRRTFALLQQAPSD